ncbi:MAG: HAMP domain-containing protein [Candidatus Rifleibacteriota bacterium]
MKTIRIVRNPGGIKLFLTWFFLILFPVLIFDISLKYFFEITEKANQQLLKEDLINEIRDFEKDLHVNEYLDQTLKSFKQNNPEIAQESDAESLAMKFFRFSGIKPSGVIIHSRNFESINSFYYDSFLQEQSGTLPKSFALKFLKNVNLAGLIDSGRGTMADSTAFNKTRAIAESFMQKQFGIISPIPFIAEKTAVSVSAKLGGFCYFFYQPFHDSKSNTDGPSGGFFFVIRGCNIDAGAIKDSAVSRASKGLTRKIEFRSFKPDQGNLANLDIMTKFEMSPENLTLSFPAPQNFLTHLISSGGFYPANLQRTIDNLPYLVVSNLPGKLEHRLKPYFKFIRPFEIFIVSFSAIICLKFLLFGWANQVRLSQKAVIAMLVAGALPVSLLVISFFTWQEINEKVQLIEVNANLKRRVEKFSNQFSIFIDEIHLKSFKISKIAEEWLALEEEELFSKIRNEMKGLFAQEAYFDLFDREKMIVGNPFIKEIPLTKEEYGLRTIILQSILRAMICIKKYENEDVLNQPEDLFKDVFFVDPGFINNVMTIKGRLIEMDQIRSFNSFSINTLFDPQNQREVKGFLTFRFNQHRLIEKFLEKADSTGLKLFSIQDPVNRKKITGINASFTSGLHNKISSAVETGKNLFWWSEDSSGLQKGHYMMIIPKFPLILMAEENLRRINTAWLHLAALFFYFVLLFYLVFQYLNHLILEPVKKFCEAAAEAGQGNFLARVDYSGKDEFNHLKISFDKMMEGMAQKEKLAEFVSDAVLQQIDKDSCDISLGGTKISASVVFGSIGSSTENFSGDEMGRLLHSLNLVIESAEKIARKNSGSLDKIFGNTIMMVFRGTSENDDHAKKACQAVLELKKELGLHNIYYQTQKSGNRLLMHFLLLALIWSPDI